MTSIALKQQQLADGLVMVKEIPLPLVRANQIMLVIGTILAILFSLKWLVVLLFIITIATLLFGPRANVAFRVTRYVLGSRLFYAHTESVEIQRFNQVIATTCLGLGTILLLLLPNFWLGWIPVAFVTLAAGAAICGYCIGCRFYFPYKMWVARMRKKYPNLNSFFDFIAGTGRFRPPLQEKPQPLMLMGLAHEALRRSLDNLDTQAKAMTPATLPAVTEAVHEVMRIVEHHAQQEDLAMYPPFEAKQKQITKEFTDEHTAIHEVEDKAVLKALEEAAANPSTVPQCIQAILHWTNFSRAHFRHEELILMPHVPRFFSHSEAVEVVQGILKIKPEDNAAHFKHVFANIRPGQRYIYANILRECCDDEEFELYAEGFKLIVPAASWDDFISATRMIG